MKKEIYCMKCKFRVQTVIDIDQLPPGEHVKYVDGVLKIGMDCVCDFCNRPLYSGMKVCCFSNFIDEKAPYQTWEEEFIHIVITPPKTEPDDIPVKGVYGLLITGDDDTLLEYLVALSMVINFHDRRLNTVHASCMNESLDLAKGLAEKIGVTLQVIDNYGENETYLLLHKGNYPRWERGGYVD